MSKATASRPALDGRPLAAVLAGLRLLQQRSFLPVDIEEIACDAGPRLSADEIDTLCQLLDAGTADEVSKFCRDPSPG